MKKPTTNSVTQKITPIATSLAVISGLVAVGAALSDKQNRALLSKQALKGLEILQTVAESLQAEELMPGDKRYQSIAHQVNLKNKARKSKKV